MSNYAFIPLRAGGKRIGPIDGRDKDQALLGGHPLMAWTITEAKESGVFDKVIAVTRSEPHADIARQYGCDDVMWRPEYTVRDSSPDIEWVMWALSELIKEDDLPEMYSILRVTSPFRTAKHIKAAWTKFIYSNAHSLRTMTPVEQHPGKMWVVHNDVALPIFPTWSEKNPWHSQGTQTLFPAYIQTAGMEMAWADMTIDTKTIAGSIVKPYIVKGLPALDINTKRDWSLAELAVKHGYAVFPK